MIKLIHGSAHKIDLPDGSIHAIITSPPYHGLRKYAGDQAVEWPGIVYSPMAGLREMIAIPGGNYALGSEPTIDMYIEHMILCLRKWWRVLRADGTCWVNLGDSYDDKTLSMIPARFALATQADGWYLRSAIVWAKGISFCPTWSGSVMPESIRDRPTASYEMVYLLAKSPKYFYDQDGAKKNPFAPVVSENWVKKACPKGKWLERE